MPTTAITISHDRPDAQLDLLAPDAIEDPYPTLARLRTEHPVHWSDAHKAWMILRYDHVATSFMDTTRFSSNRISPLIAAASAKGVPEAVSGVLRIMADWMVVSDPPVHTRLRRLITDAFRPQRMLALEGAMRSVADGLLDEYSACGDPNLVTNYSYPLPAAVIGELIGAPPEDRDNLREWSFAFSQVAFGGGGENDPARHENAYDGLRNMIRYFLERIEVTRRSPADNLIGNCLEVNADGDRLSDQEIAGMCALLLFAGHETSANLISSALLALHRHPEQRRLVDADISVINSVVEESLRYDGPVKALARWCVADIEIGGRTIPARSKVYFVLSAANRDPEKFPDPDRYDITRTPNAHLGFGRGVHACIGALMARIETRVALAAIFERYPNWTIDDAGVEWEVSREARALHNLPMALGEPAARA
ncbi:MAG: cytochrome [Conexibacter sp.]|nr:cytochrome [Conexibacter sp.]